MNFLRLLARLLFWFALFAVIILAILCVPAVQTWVGQTFLERHPESGVSIGDISVGWKSVKITELKVTARNGVTLVAPSVEAHFPLRAWWTRGFEFETVSAQGWTVDLGGTADVKAKSLLAETFSGSAVRSSANASATANSVADSPVAGAKSDDGFRGLLSQIQLPVDLAIETVALDGEIIGARDGDRTKLRLHLKIAGGELGKGREGKLTVNYAGTATYLEGGMQIVQISGSSQCKITMATPRTLKAIAVSATVAAKGGVLSHDFNATLDASVVGQNDSESYAVDFVREQRHLAKLDGKFVETPRRIEGTWTLDLNEADWASLAADHSWPSLTGKGRGDFRRDFAPAGLHATGEIDVAINKIGAFFPAFASAGPVTVKTKFDASRAENVIHVEQLQAELSAPTPVGTVRATQAFDLNLTNGALTMRDPKKNVLAISLQDLPLAWLPRSIGGFTFSRGSLAGELSLRADRGIFALRSESPLTATHVTVQNGVRTLATELDVSTALTATRNPEGWQLECAPLILSHDGSDLARLEIKWIQSALRNAPLKTIGKWSANLTALRALPDAARFGWEDATAANGDFSVESGNPAKWSGLIAVTGSDPTHVLTTRFSADVGASPVIAFRAPIKISLGAVSSEVTAEGTWSGSGKGNWIDLHLGGKEGRLDQLRVLLSPFLGAGKSYLVNDVKTTNRDSTTPVAERDSAPFWGDVTGKLSLGFDQLHVGEGEIKGVRGTLLIEAKAVKIQTGLYSLPDQGLARVDGTLTFDATAERPYQLQLTLADSDVDGATAFPVPKEDHDPVFHGKFSVGSTASGSGLTLDDLASHTEQEFLLKSPSGIVRFLKTNVADTMKQPTTPVGDALGTMGSLVGKIFGKNDVEKGEIRLSKNADAVIDFSYRVAELGYQDITIGAARTAEGLVRLKQIAMTAGELRVGGSGEIKFLPGKKLSARPLQADLKFAVRGKLAELLAPSGLLSTEKDADGFTAFVKSVKVGGTLEQLDIQAWHDLLAEAANRPDPPKKTAAKK